MARDLSRPYFVQDSIFLTRDDLSKWNDAPRVNDQGIMENLYLDRFSMHFEQCQIEAHGRKFDYPSLCAYHHAERIKDHKNHHLMQRFEDLERAARSYTNSSCLNSNEIGEHMYQVNRGYDRYWTAAREHFLRIVYEVRYALTPDEGHTRWCEHLKSIDGKHFVVNLNGVFATPYRQHYLERLAEKIDRDQRQALEDDID